QYAVDDVVEFHRAAPDVPVGTRLTVAAVLPDRVRVVGPAGTALDLPLHLADRFQLYRPAACRLSAGDRIRVTRNGKTRDGRHRLNNGTVHTVAGFAPDGDVLLDNGWAVGRDL